MSTFTMNILSAIDTFDAKEYIPGNKVIYIVMLWFSVFQSSYL